jgi:hypothetical protein
MQATVVKANGQGRVGEAMGEGEVKVKVKVKVKVEG